MSQPLAIVDTSVLILLLSTPGQETEEIRVRRERTEIAIQAVLKAGARLAVPTPAVAELARHGKGADVARRLLAALTRRCRFEDLDIAAAEAAGSMRLDRLNARAAGDERGAISYDALIAGIAHARGARWLLTANARDFVAALKVLSSPVEVLRTDDVPPKGQLSLVHQQQPVPSAPADAPKAQEATKKGS